MAATRINIYMTDYDLDILTTLTQLMGENRGVVIRQALADLYIKKSDEANENVNMPITK